MERAAFLFDIDGTLLYARGIGRAAFGTAFETAYGVPYPDLAGLTFVGATDSNVVRTMAATCGVASTPAREEHFFLLLTQAIDAGLAQTKPLVYPGVPALLDRLCKEGYPLGLITGNIRATAWAKLRHAGLDAAFCFGAYGDDDPDRNVIARLALQRVPHGVRARVLIGDTPLDIQAAHANGLIAVAVATGWVTADALAAAGADLVLDDFSDTETVLAQLKALLASCNPG
ncbi:MAG TPA: HAD family hydrolase [Kiritimatiellia bacterium]|jgi:phosphoglycolate phosphatase-like HAD superfamily hydrolase|nr:HAD family hydrolase [Kiritimatiellia bacterium]HOR98158.1 HAD family hydrolase [Kiritimatiellia bacterium]HPW75525.1 HAD family hydrolase [Kiritimatiellia bacterium]HRU20057.1 HAD family hydrolase [Kiritimatiellia bacterium]